MNNFSIGTPVNAATTGIATFAKCPICTDIRTIEADIGILGAPFDIAIQGRLGTRLGPRGIRIGSTRFSYKPGGTYDPEHKMMYLDTNRWTIQDCGDVDYVPGDLEATNANLTEAVKILVARKVFPVIWGGDHSITYPVLCGMGQSGPFDITHRCAFGLDAVCGRPAPQQWIAHALCSGSGLCREHPALGYTGHRQQRTLGFCGCGRSWRSTLLREASEKGRDRRSPVLDAAKAKGLCDL